MDPAGVGDLAARLCVEGRLTQLKHNVTAFQLPQIADGSVKFVLLIANKLRVDLRVATELDQGFALLRAHLFHGTARALPLLFHQPVEFLIVDVEPFILDDFAGKVEGKAVSIVQPEGYVALDEVATDLPFLLDGLHQDGVTLFKSQAKAALLLGDDLFDHPAVLLQLRIGVLH